MPQAARLWVKYCGGCNPRIVRTSVVRDVVARLEERSGRSVVVAYPADALPEAPSGVLIIVSGCLADCATRPANVSLFPIVVVAGETVQGRAVPAGRLVERVAEAVEEALNLLGGGAGNAGQLSSETTAAAETG